MHKSLAWDSVGHRLSASLATHYLSENTKIELLRILQQHPRYQQDFIEQMPGSISRGSENERVIWLLGQAAFWPDIARGFEESEQEKYNRANWHYIDGAWLRGQATAQGNTYIGIIPFVDVIGKAAHRIKSEADVDNIMYALDFNTALLANSQASMAQRAVALCWVLHLIGDLHQPLHTGSLYSEKRFAKGDRGGNGIATDDRSLHARWDRALRNGGIQFNLETILKQHAKELEDITKRDNGDWSLWLMESRRLLLKSVYTTEMKSSIALADRSNKQLRKFNLNEDYIETMEYHARLRLAFAGRRLANWFENNL